MLRSGRLLLAGSWGPERSAARRDVDDPAWFEPLHVRDVDGARDRLTTQIAVGADVVIAPTWQTHRRALLPVGETRRARAWTAAAVETARQAVEAGLEARETAAQQRSAAELVDRDDARADATDGPDASQQRLDITRPSPLVAGILPRLDDEAAVAGGRLATADVAQERDYRDQAGLLADAEVDLILIEGLTTISATRAALGAVAATGLGAWIAAPAAVAPTATTTASFERWRDICTEAGAALLLAPPAAAAQREAELDAAADILAAGSTRWGFQTSPPGAAAGATVAGSMERGATVVGLLDAATGDNLLPLRDAIDRYEQAEREADRQRTDRWQGFVQQAARMAPGGQALTITDTGADAASRLPEGFDWTQAPPEALASLPTDRFRLVIAPLPSLDLDALASTLEVGGLLAAVRTEHVRVPTRTSLVVLDDAPSPTMVLLRREP